MFDLNVTAFVLRIATSLFILRNQDLTIKTYIVYKMVFTRIKHCAKHLLQNFTVGAYMLPRVNEHVNSHLQCLSQGYPE